MRASTTMLFYAVQRTHALRTSVAGSPPPSPPPPGPPPSGSSSYTLAWTPDGYYANGVVLGGGDLQGFNIYGSQTEQDVNPTLLATVADPSSTGTTLTGLAAGPWYFSVTAYTAAAESDPVASIPVTLS